MRWSGLVTLTAAAAAVVLHGQAEAALLASRTAAAADPAWVPQASVVKQCDFGMDRFMADFYWLSFVQYMGDQPERDKRGYGKASDFVWLICKLDPQFPKVYWFGCWSVGYWQKRPDIADEILRYGMSHNPNDWDLPFLAGINQYLFAKQPAKAAKYYEIASKKPGAPAFIARQARTLASTMPEYVKRIHTLIDLFVSTDDINMKRNLASELITYQERIIQIAPLEKTKQGSRDQIKWIREKLAEAEAKK